MFWLHWTVQKQKVSTGVVLPKLLFSAWFFGKVCLKRFLLALALISFLCGIKAADNVKWKIIYSDYFFLQWTFFFLHVLGFCNIFLCNGCEHSFIFKVILVQVNPGEAFTIRREDGQFQCITGKTYIIYIYNISTFYIKINKRQFLVLKVKDCK